MLNLLNKTSKKQNKPITKEQVAVLIHFCFCNAQDLYEEAELLKKNKKFARGFYLCVSALEELAKIPIVLNALFLPPNDLKAWAGFWKRFNNHEVKQRAAKKYGQTFLKNMDKSYKDQIPDSLPINNLKWASLYVDCLDGHPIRPNKIFKNDNRHVSSIFKITKDRLEGLGRLHSTLDGSIRFVRITKETTIKMDGKDFKELVATYFRDHPLKK